MWVRSGALVGAPDLIEELGHDAGTLLREAGIDPAALHNPDFPIPVAGVISLLERAAEVCVCETFGLELSRRQDMASIFGPIWPIFRSAPNVAALLQDLAEFFPLQTRGALVSIEAVQDGMFVNYELAAGMPASRRQVIELGFGILSLELQRWAPGWRPREVLFRHRAPARLALHRQIFGSQITFNSDRNAVFVDAKLIAVPNPLGDAAVHGRLAYHLEHQRRALPGRNHAETEILVRGMLPFAPCDLAVCARLLRLSPRTLQLAGEGTSFAEIADKVRADLALSYLRSSDLKTAAVAEILQYSETSALSRALRRWYGISPRQARAGFGNNRNCNESRNWGHAIGFVIAPARQASHGAL